MSEKTVAVKIWARTVGVDFMRHPKLRGIISLASTGRIVAETMVRPAGMAATALRDARAFAAFAGWVVVDGSPGGGVDAVSYKISYTDGTTERRASYASYDEAIAAVHAVYPDAAIGHDGDITQGNEQTLCWVDDETATNDEGRRACCVISISHDARYRDYDAET